MNRTQTSGGYDASSDRDNRDRDRERRAPPKTGRGAVEAQMTDVAKGLDKPLLSGDFAAQATLLKSLRDRLGTVKPTTLASFEFDPRTRLFTALLRVKNQPAVKPAAADATPEQLAEHKAKTDGRNRAFAELGALWKLLGEADRATQAFEQAGDARIAMEKAGTWEEAALIHAREGRHTAAAKLYEAHKLPVRAAELHAEGGDVAQAVRLYIGAGQTEPAREALKKLATPVAQKLLIELGAGDLLMDLLAARGRWEDIGKLYQRAGQHPDAAQAFLKAGRTHMAVQALQKAGDPEGAQKIIEQDAAAAREKGDARGAGRSYERWKQYVSAAKEVAASDPELALSWVQKAGQDPAALEFAKSEAARHQAAGDVGLQGKWTALAGDAAAAQPLFLQAAAAAEQAGDTRKAIDYFQRAGDKAAVERLKPAKPEPKPEAPVEAQPAADAAPVAAPVPDSRVEVSAGEAAALATLAPDPKPA
jgi:hypothetical protein